MKDIGKVLEVSVITIGDEVTRQHNIGESILFLNDVAEFSEDGGRVDINGFQYDYTTIDDDLSTMTLATPLGQVVNDESLVNVYPVAEELVALVQTDEEEDPIECPVTQSMVPLIPEGVRDEDQQEAVVVEHDGNEWTIVDFPGSPPVQDLSEYSYVPAGKVVPVYGSFEVRDVNENVRQIIGEHVGGVYTSSDYNAPAPPNPTGLTISAVVGGIQVAWSGAASLPIPADFARLRIDMSATNGYTPTAATDVASINTTNGGIVTIPAVAGTIKYIRCALVNTSGIASAFTAQAAVTPTAAGTGVKTYIQATKPAIPAGEGDVWWEDDAGNRQYRYDSVTAHDFVPVEVGGKALDFSPLGGLMGNLLKDAGFLDTNINAQRILDSDKGSMAGTATWSFVSVPDAPDPTGIGGISTGTVARCVTSAATGAAAWPKIKLQEDIPVLPGMVFYHGSQARVKSGACTAYSVVQWRRQDGTMAAGFQRAAPLTVAQGWVEFGGQLDIPHDAVSATVFIEFTATSGACTLEFFNPILAFAGYWSPQGNRITLSPGIFEVQAPGIEIVAYVNDEQVRIRGFDAGDIARREVVVAPDGAWMNARDAAGVELHNMSMNDDTAAIATFDSAGNAIDSIELHDDHQVFAYINGDLRFWVSPTITQLLAPAGVNFLELSDTQITAGDRIQSGSPPSSKRYRNSSLNVPNSSWTIVDCGAIEHQWGVTYSAGTYTITLEGVYMLGFHFPWLSVTSPNGRRVGGIWIDGVLDEKIGIQGVASVDLATSLQTIRYLTVGQTVSFQAWHNNGASPTMQLVATEESLNIFLHRLDD